MLPCEGGVMMVMDVATPPERLRGSVLLLLLAATVAALVLAEGAAALIVSV